MAVMALALPMADRQAAVEGPECGRGATETHCAAAQDSCGSIGGGRGSRAEQTPAGDLIVGGQRGPGGEMVLGRPAAHVGADLSDQLQRGLRPDGMDLAQVSTASE